MKKLLLTMIAIASVVLLSTISLPAGEIAFVVNKNSPLASGLTKQKIKDIFLGNVKFENNTKLIPLRQNDETLLKEFVEGFLDMTPTAYKNYWVKKVFAEGGSAPKAIENPHDITRYVWQNLGVIGYVRETELTEREKELLHVITIIK